LVVCPECGSRIPARKIMVLTSMNAITCGVCSSRLRVKNKGVSRMIGVVAAILITPLAFFLNYSWLRTGNLAHLALLIFSASAILLGVFLIDNKYIKLQPETSSKT
jgi:DNA-directed RNA polymerase subunit RPC12/RpoP